MSAGAVCAAALVLMLDGSNSIKAPDWETQVRGHAEALAAPSFWEVAERDGGIAVAGIVFAEQDAIVPWTIVRSQADAQALARRFAAIERPQFVWGTYTAAALETALELQTTAPCQADNQVVDIATDGIATDWGRLPHVIERAGEMGVKVNVLAVGMKDDDVDWVRRTSVTPGGFLMHIEEWSEFPRAIARKIRLELGQAFQIQGGW